MIRFWSKFWIGVLGVASKPKNPGNMSPSTIHFSSGSTWLRYNGCFRCGEARCGLCKFISSANNFISYSNSKTFNITTLTNCNTTHVVYLAGCTECRLQYVGCTTSKAKIRLGEPPPTLTVAYQVFLDTSNFPMEENLLNCRSVS